MSNKRSYTIQYTVGDDETLRTREVSVVSFDACEDVDGIRKGLEDHYPGKQIEIRRVSLYC